jgi:hypothetical protein
MLSAIFSAVGGQIVDGLLGRITGVFEAYFKKQVSIEELRTQLAKALLETFADVEKAHSELIAKTFESFQVTLRQSPMLQRVWVWVVFTQLGVLLWHQVGIPAFVYFTGHGYPSSGSTVEWAYALIGFMFGAGALILRTGPGAGGTVIDRMKAAIGK